MISNPCAWFSGGGSSDDQVRFTYEGGAYLYHFSPHDNGWSGTMENNLLFLADDEEHARDVFKRMCRFSMGALRRQSNYYSGSNLTKMPHTEEFHIRIRSTYSKFEFYLAHADEAKFVRAPTNQFYLVGWADNDTLH